MGKLIRTNEKNPKMNFEDQESIFAQQVLQHIGGSCVYVAGKKFVDKEDATKGL